MKKGVFLIVCLLQILAVSAQEKTKSFFPVTIYGQAKFGSPVKIPISLAGNFGECRSNHFHSGIDVRTNQQENMNLYSIGDGYVSRVSISHKGFGNCIYISHPGGYTSVYAHCNRFFRALEKYVKKKQYQKETWAVELQFPPHLFPIKKGNFIAKSGNTGASHAPHLHMEIRSTQTDKTLNGLLFYPKMADNKKPVVSRIGIYDANKSIYQQEPFVLSAINKGGYDIPGSEFIKVHSAQVYFGIQANDYMENSLRLGIFRMKLIVDGKAQFGWQLNNIGYNETRYMNAIGDYRTKMNRGFWLQLCHRLPNDQLEVYIKGTKSNGVVDLRDGRPHKIIIRCYDVKGNFKDVRFVIQSDAPKKADKNIPAGCAKFFKQGQMNAYNDGKIAFSLNKKMLYDDVCFQAVVAPNELPYSYLYRVHRADVPIHDSFELRLKPKQAIPAELQNKLVVMYAADDKMEEADGKAAIFKNGWATVMVRAFGNYEIRIDKQAPSIIPYFKNGQKISQGSSLRFGAEDDLTELKEVRLTVDGKWLRCARRHNVYTYSVDEHFPVGTHEVAIKAVDGNGNTSIKKMQIVR